MVLNLNTNAVKPKSSFDLIKRKYAVDLSGHIAQCETNYARIMRLLPDMAHADYREFGLFAAHGSGRRFSVKVVERCKYTTMLHVSEIDEDDGIEQSSQTASRDEQDSSLTSTFISPPSFVLRVYHDAQMVEVTQYLRHRHIQPRYNYPNHQMHQSDEKAQWNIFLGEWLSHCLKHGYLLEHFRLDDTLTTQDVNASLG